MSQGIKIFFWLSLLTVLPIWGAAEEKRGAPISTAPSSSGQVRTHAVSKPSPAAKDAYRPLTEGSELTLDQDATTSLQESVDWLTMFNSDKENTGEK